MRLPSRPVLRARRVRPIVAAALAGLFCALFAPRAAAAADVAGFVDVRQLALCHPLLRLFDPHSRRFRETASAFVADPEKARAEYQKQIDLLRDHQKALDDKFRAVLKIGDPRQRKAETDRLWLEKNDAKQRMEQLQQAIEATKRRGNYLHGAATGVESIIPLVRRIVADIGLVVRQLSARYGNIPILDASCAESPATRAVCDRAILFANLHAGIWAGSPDPAALRGWLQQLRRHLRDRWPDRFGTPFRTNFRDLRLEAVGLLTGSGR